MYQIFGLKALITAYAMIASLVATICLLIQGADVPFSVWGWPEFLWKPASVGLTVTGLLFWLLGQTGIFPALCRHTRFQKIFPDIHGEWTGALTSNWPIIEAHGTERIVNGQLLSRPSTIQIHASLFEVRLTLETNDSYSKSTTVLVGVTRDNVTSSCTFNYIYRNETLNPLPTDEQFHFGAATLTLKRIGNELVLEGPYWTNRNWKKGLNTAGIATFRKRLAAASDLAPDADGNLRGH